MSNPNPKNNNKAARGKNKRAGNVKLSSAEQRDVLAKQLRLRPKTKAFVDELLNNKGITQTEAYRRIHPEASNKTATVEASKLLTKPNVLIYRDSAVSKAKSTVVSLMDSDNETIKLKSATEILDRSLGKAVQKNETTVRTVEVKLDLTGLRVGSHHIQAPIVPIIAE